jgi:hypothetical protein
MVAQGAHEAGDWKGWLEPVRDQIQRSGLASWSACDGEITTATYTGPSDPAAVVPPVVLTLARWRDGEIACVGELSLSDVHIPIASDLSPGPGDEIEVALPEIGATFELPS